MRQLYILLIIIFIPNICHAALGDDLNSIINKFWGNEGAFEPETDPEEISPNEDNIEIPESYSVEEIQEEIMMEESSMLDFEEQIYDKQQELWKDRNRKKSTQTDLSILDSEISLISDKLIKFNEQEKKWKSDLEDLTREKSEISATLRVEKRELEKFMARNYIRSETFGSEDVPVLKWLFSDKTVAEILEEKQRSRQFEVEKKQKLSRLSVLKSGFDQKEKMAANLYAKVSDLAQKTASSKQNLTSMSHAKANLVARLEYTEGQHMAELENYRNAQAESTVVLQNLRQALNEAHERDALLSQKESGEFSLDNVVGSVLDFPIQIPIEIVAGFHDPKYEEEFEEVHEAVDLFAPQGTTIYAPADGVVQKVLENGYDYSYFIIEHRADFFTVYGHVSEINVVKGQEVKRGEVLGKTGGTPGSAGAGFFTSGPHLHFEVFHDGKFVDPMNFLPKEE